MQTVLHFSGLHLKNLKTFGSYLKSFKMSVDYELIHVKSVKVTMVLELNVFCCS